MSLATTRDALFNDAPNLMQRSSKRLLWLVAWASSATLSSWSSSQSITSSLVAHKWNESNSQRKGVGADRQQFLCQRGVHAIAEGKCGSLNLLPYLIPGDNL